MCEIFVEIPRFEISNRFCRKGTYGTVEIPGFHMTEYSFLKIIGLKDEAKLALTAVLCGAVQVGKGRVYASSKPAVFLSKNFNFDNSIDIETIILDFMSRNSDRLKLEFQNIASRLNVLDVLNLTSMKVKYGNLSKKQKAFLILFLIAMCEPRIVILESSLCKRINLEIKSYIEFMNPSARIIISLGDLNFLSKSWKKYEVINERKD